MEFKYLGSRTRLELEVKVDVKLELTTFIKPNAQKFIGRIRGQITQHCDVDDT